MSSDQKARDRTVSLLTGTISFTTDMTTSTQELYSLSIARTWDPGAETRSSQLDKASSHRLSNASQSQFLRSQVKRGAFLTGLPVEVPIEKLIAQWSVGKASKERQLVHLGAKALDASVKSRIEVVFFEIRVGWACALMSNRFESTTK